MISSNTWADASMRLAISDWSLSSADQLTPMKTEQMLSTRRHLGNTEETRLIVMSFSVLDGSTRYSSCEDHGSPCVPSVPSGGPGTRKRIFIQKTLDLERQTSLFSSRVQA